MARLKAFWAAEHVRRFSAYQRERVEPDVVWVARQAETHGVPCGCYLCKYPKGLPTVQQAGALRSYREQLLELE